MEKKKNIPIFLFKLVCMFIFLDISTTFICVILLGFSEGNDFPRRLFELGLIGWFIWISIYFLFCIFLFKSIKFTQKYANKLKKGKELANKTLIIMLIIYVVRLSSAPLGNILLILTNLLL